MRMRDCVTYLLQFGRESEFEMISCFDISRRFGGTTKTDLIAMTGYVIAAFRGLILPYSGGYFVLSAKGIAEKQTRRLGS